MSALAYKAKANAIVVVEDVTLETPKTKSFMSILNSLNVGEKKLMFILPEYNDNVYISSRNVSSVLTMLMSDVNTYDIVNSEVLVLTESAAKIFAGSEEEEVPA
jgi:large subunit ribosomal protein L4